MNINAKTDNCGRDVEVMERKRVSERESEGLSVGSTLIHFPSDCDWLDLRLAARWVKFGL